ncbi:hypothetical protein [Desulfofundulus sp.]|uniref:hypothetical protein n=1 Tax=Desulfofundulus sp. TaxID=2282750 RepID=UPI003C746A3E
MSVLKVERPLIVEFIKEVKEELERVGVASAGCVEFRPPEPGALDLAGIQLILSLHKTYPHLKIEIELPGWAMKFINGGNGK